MNPVLLARRSVLAMVAAASLGPAWAASPSESGVLDNAAFDALVADPSKVLIIDVRRPDEISANGGFPVYLNVQPDQIEARAASIPRDRVLITVSNHAARAKKAAATLAALGFKVAGAIGAQNYEEAGGKLTRVATPAPKP